MEASQTEGGGSVLVMRYQEVTQRLRRRAWRRDLRGQKSGDPTPFKPGWSCQESLHVSATRWRPYSPLEIGETPGDTGRGTSGGGCSLGPCFPSRK